MSSVFGFFYVGGDNRPDWVALPAPHPNQAIFEDRATLSEPVQILITEFWTCDACQGVRRPKCPQCQGSGVVITKA